MIEVNDESYAKIRKVGEDLLGTCSNPDHIAQEIFEDEDLSLGDLPIELLHELDAITMECVACNWWHEPHELDDDQVCHDCGGTPEGYETD